MYILMNVTKTKTYIGITSNVDRRLEEHNSGNVKSTKYYRPYEVVLVEGFKLKQEARDREVYYKSRTGRRRMKKVVDCMGPSKC